MTILALSRQHARLRDANPNINQGLLSVETWHADLLHDKHLNRLIEIFGKHAVGEQMQTIINGFIFDRPKWDPLTTSSNSYVSVNCHTPTDLTLAKTYWPCEILGGKTLYFVATVHDLLVTILGSLDGGATFPLTAEAEFTVAVGTPVRKDVSNIFHGLRIQVKPASNNVHGTLAVYGGGSSLPGMSDVSITADVDTQALQDLVGALISPAAGSVNKQLADMAADIALMKADLAAIRVILES